MIHRPLARFGAFLLVVLCGATSSRAQYDEGTAAFGLALQVHSNGIIPGVQARTPLTRFDALTLHLGLQVMDRGDAGEHETEEGSGAGAGLGLRHSLLPGHRGPFFGVRTDVWFISVDWFDNNRTRRGTTDVGVVQPTGQVGYVLSVAGGRVDVEVNLSFGREFNFRTKGEEVGQGYILLGGIGIGYRLPSPS